MLVWMQPHIKPYLRLQPKRSRHFSHTVQKLDLIPPLTFSSFTQIFCLIHWCIFRSFTNLISCSLSLSQTLTSVSYFYFRIHHHLSLCCCHRWPVFHFLLIFLSFSFTSSHSLSACLAFFHLHKPNLWLCLSSFTISGFFLLVIASSLSHYFIHKRLNYPKFIPLFLCHHYCCKAVKSFPFLSISCTLSFVRDSFLHPVHLVLIARSSPGSGRCYTERRGLR